MRIRWGPARWPEGADRPSVGNEVHMARRMGDTDLAALSCAERKEMSEYPSERTSDVRERGAEDSDAAIGADQRREHWYPQPDSNRRSPP